MRTALLTFVAIGAVALFALWFFATHEKVVKEVPATYRGEARLNDFLAAEMLLRELGFEADSRSSLKPSAWLPDPTDTLLVRLSGAVAGAHELELLETWVADGGHLVLLAPEQSTSLTAEAMRLFGLRLIEIERGPGTSGGERMLQAGRDVGPGAVAYQVHGAGPLKGLEITDAGFDGVTLLDDHGVVAARRRWGSGFLTVMAGSSWFENASLAEADHARLLLDAVAGYVQPGKVWFVYDAAFPPLWRLVWDSFSYVVAGAGLTALLWLWSVMPRFGPPITPAPPTRRSIVEHVEAAARFVWQSGGADTLVASSAGAVLRRAKSRHFRAGHLALDEQAAVIAKMTGKPLRAVRAALAPAGQIGKRDFTNRIHALQTLRNEL